MKYWFWSLMVVLVFLTIYGKLPPTGVNAWIGFLLSISFLGLMLVALPILSSRERKARELGESVKLAPEAIKPAQEATKEGAKPAKEAGDRKADQ